VTKLLKPDRIEVLDIYSGDTGGCTLESWRPPDPRRVHICLYVVLGWNGAATGDDFVVEVMTRDLRLSSKRGQNTIYVDEFDGLTIRNSILHIVAKCERDTENESWVELRKRFAWEYESIG
jgi:hypothetical protein